MQVARRRLPRLAPARERVRKTEVFRSVRNVSGALVPPAGRCFAAARTAGGNCKRPAASLLAFALLCSKATRFL